MPTDMPIATQSEVASDGELIALFSLVPGFISLLLVHACPAIAGAFVLLGQLG